MELAPYNGTIPEPERSVGKVPRTGKRCRQLNASAGLWISSPNWLWIHPYHHLQSSSVLENKQRKNATEKIHFVQEKQGTEWNPHPKVSWAPERNGTSPIKRITFLAGPTMLVSSKAFCSSAFPWFSQLVLTLSPCKRTVAILKKDSGSRGTNSFLARTPNYRLGHSFWQVLSCFGRWQWKFCEDKDPSTAELSLCKTYIIIAVWLFWSSVDFLLLFLLAKPVWSWLLCHWMAMVLAGRLLVLDLTPTVVHQARSYHTCRTQANSTKFICDVDAPNKLPCWDTELSWQDVRSKK